MIMNNKLRKKLLKMRNEDQKTCKAELNQNRRKKDITEIKKIVNTFGWPIFDLVGVDGSNAAWLLVQHSNDISFQKQCLELMKDAVKRNQTSSEDLAYLKDRVAINSGRKQLYGTQFHINDKGEYAPWPIKYIKNIEERRKKLGMQTFKAYKKYMIIKYRSGHH